MKRRCIAAFTAAAIFTLVAAFPAAAHEGTGDPFGGGSISDDVRAGNDGDVVGTAWVLRDDDSIAIHVHGDDAITNSHVCIDDEPFVERESPGQCPFQHTGSSSTYEVDYDIPVPAEWSDVTVFLQIHAHTGGQSAFVAWMPAVKKVTPFYGNLGVDAPAEEPVEEPTDEPTEEPTDEPTEGPSDEPTEEPSDEPTDEPTVEPTDEPTVEPSEEPTDAPTVEPTDEPTVEPTEEPTDEPTVEPTDEPTVEPTEEPTEEPTDEPTVEPTNEPTVEPTVEPTEEPTDEPTVEPTDEPTVVPSDEPTVESSEEPMDEPTLVPSDEPTLDPTDEPAVDPGSSVGGEVALSDIDDLPVSSTTKELGVGGEQAERAAALATTGFDAITVARAGLGMMLVGAFLWLTAHAGRRHGKPPVRIIVDTRR